MTAGPSWWPVGRIDGAAAAVRAAPASPEDVIVLASTAREPVFRAAGTRPQLDALGTRFSGQQDPA